MSVLHAHKYAEVPWMFFISPIFDIAQLLLRAMVPISYSRIEPMLCQSQTLKCTKSNFVFALTEKYEKTIKCKIIEDIP